jgi:hypothetical protein
MKFLKYCLKFFSESHHYCSVAVGRSHDTVPLLNPLRCLPLSLACESIHYLRFRVATERNLARLDFCALLVGTKAMPTAGNFSDGGSAAVAV